VTLLAYSYNVGKRALVIGYVCDAPNPRTIYLAFHNGGRVLVQIGASVHLEGLAGSAIELMMFHMAHVSWNDACAVFYSLCTSTSILGRRHLVEFVLGCTRRHDRDESKIVAFHIKIIIYRTDSRILSFW